MNYINDANMNSQQAYSNQFYKEQATMNFDTI